jgi:excisionase family DNA binding protein
MPKKTPRMFTIGETAYRLGVSYRQVWRFLGDGELQGVDVARPGAQRRAMRIDETEIEQYLARHRTERPA